jgi:hypothetical protein
LPAPAADPEALFREARRRRRHRRLVVLAVLVLVAGGTATGIALGQGSAHGGSGGAHRHGAPTAPRTAPPAASVARPSGVALPSSGFFNQIAVTPSGLLLTGVTPATAGSPLPVCVSAPVDPLTLAVGRLETGNCGDPRMFGQTIEVVNSPILQTNNAGISINSLDPVSGRVVYGPVVMTYSSYSDTRPVTSSAGPWLWIYDNDTTKGSVLLQISEQSGAVVDTIPAPVLYKPLLAADSGGVWIANAIGGSPAPALFYAPAGSSAAHVVVSSTVTPICWIVASGTGAWVGAGVQGCGTQDVRRYVDGSDAPVFSTAGTTLPFTVIGNESDGLWSMQYATPTEEEIVHIDPGTGVESVVATVPAVALPSSLTDGGLVAGQGAYFDGRLYLLEPPFHKNGYLGYESIVGVPVPAGG